MLWEQEDIDEKVILGLFLNLRDDKGWGRGGRKLTYTAIPLGLTLL